MRIEFAIIGVFSGMKTGFRLEDLYQGENHSRILEHGNLFELNSSAHTRIFFFTLARSR